MNQEDKALLRVITSTKKKGRPFNLLEISVDIKHLIKHHGDLSKVAELIGISPGMINQFLRVDKISHRVQDLVERRVIDSVSIVNSLSRLPHEEQNAIADYIIDGKLNSLDIRYLIPLRNKLPDLSIEDLVKKLKDSENIKISVINFPSEITSLSKEQIQEKIIRLVGLENVVSVELDENIGSIKMTPIGEKILRKKAKSAKKTLSVFTHSLLS